MNAASETSVTKGLYAVIIYCILTTLVDINISAAGNGQGFTFEPACAVLIIEVLKMVFSLVLYTMSRFPAMTKGEPFVQQEFSMKDIWYLAIPGALYCLNNILIYLALGYNELASFGVFRDTNVIFTAIIWCIVFKATLGCHRNLAIGGVFLGLFVNQATPLMNATWSPAIVLIVAMALTNSCASVSNELAIKQNSGMDLNLQNSVLYAFCSFAALLYLATQNPAKLTSLSGFFEGMGQSALVIVCVQGITGLMVSRILKYADAVTKTIAGALRGPILVFIAPVAGLHSRLDVPTIISAFIVSAASCYFLMQGRPDTKAQQNETVSSK
jgi:drug/metabolite transporter (DMT)-like permease